MTFQTDGFNVPHGDDTHYISKEDQRNAITLENDGLCRPFRISTTATTSIYLVVWHEQHEAPAHLVLSPFTLPQYPHQTFYGAYLWYTRCCDKGPSQAAITTTLRRVYNIYFPLGKCQFEKHNQQEVHVDAATESSCHGRAQRGLGRLQEGPDSALKRQWNGSSHESLDSVSEPLTERSSKRRRRGDPEEGGLAPTDSRQDSPRQDSPRQDSPRQDSPRQGKEQQGKKEDARAIATKATNGLDKLRVKDKDTGVSRDIALFTELPVELTDGCIQVKAHQSRHCTQDSITIWQFANNHHSKARATVWLLRLVSSCLSMIETSLHDKAPSLGTKEDKQKSRWVNGMSILNRIIDQVGFMGLRLYDAYAKNHFYFSQYAKKAEDYRNSIADLSAKAILKEGISAPENSRVLYIPYLVWIIFDSNNKGRLSKADVCKFLGLESFAKFQIDSPIVSLHELYVEQMRVQSPRPNINTERLFHEDGWRISVVEVSTPATAAFDAGVAITPGSRSSLEDAGSQGSVTSNEASGRPQESQTQHSAMEPSGEVNTARKDLGPSCAQQLSTQECLPNQPRSQSVPLNPASANPTMAALNNQVERVAPQTPPAFNVRRQETIVPVNSGSPLEQDFPPNRPHSFPPSHRPAEVAHQLQPGYTPPPPPTIQILPNSPTIQSHGIESPLNRRSGSRGELPIQTPPASPQPSQQPEADTTHQPALWAPVTREQANTAAKDIDLESSMQDPSPVQPCGHESSHGAAETLCYAQQRSVPPHSPTIRTLASTTPIQNRVTRAVSLEPRLESWGHVPTQEPPNNPPFLQELGSGMPLAQQQSCQPEQPGSRGSFDRPIDTNEPSRTPTITIGTIPDTLPNPSLSTSVQHHQVQVPNQALPSLGVALPEVDNARHKTSSGLKSISPVEPSGHECSGQVSIPPCSTQSALVSTNVSTHGSGFSTMQDMMREITEGSPGWSTDTATHGKVWDLSDATMPEYDSFWNDPIIDLGLEAQLES